MTLRTLFLLSFTALSLSACATSSVGDRAVVGGAIGLGIGAVTGSAPGAIAGAAIGAAIGAASH